MKATLSIIFIFSYLFLNNFATANDYQSMDVEDGFYELDINQGFNFLGCKKANQEQLNMVNLGNTKAQKFYERCLASNNNSSWCKQVLRPNPSSTSTFKCTYGDQQPHQLVNPDERSWPYAIQGIRLVRELESLGIKVCLIYNWWRPEPYNANVGGAAGRHPFGTSVDVRFCSSNDMEKAFSKLCQWRAAGRLRAVGYYGTNSLHLGVGDSLGNTWGKSCPRNISLTAVGE